MSKYQLQIPGWFRTILQEPDWYNKMTRLRGSLLLGAVALRNGSVLDAGANPSKQTRQLLVRIFEQLMLEGAVALGKAGPNWDEERKDVDMIVIHHTGRSRPIRLSELNALHLLRLYVTKYQNPGPEASLISGTPIYSGHSDADGQQVFYGYHWIVRPDGKTERLLPDAAIGWHAGNWDANMRSVAVCLDGDLAASTPTPEAISSVAELIANGYPDLSSAQIVGHKDVVQTTCPGDKFGVWGAELRALVEATRRR